MQIYWREKAGKKRLFFLLQNMEFCCDVYLLCMFQRDAYEDLMAKAQSCPTVSAVRRGLCFMVLVRVVSTAWMSWLFLGFVE